MNLIPDQAQDTGNYWCTWRSQATACGNKNLVKVHTGKAADAIGEEFLFGEIGALVHYISPEVRGDLIVVLDDGWDVPYDLKPSWHNDGSDDLFQYGSMIVNEELIHAIGLTVQSCASELPGLLIQAM